MPKGLLGKLRIWGEALAELDDPHGDYLRGLENRIRLLEDAVAVLRNDRLIAPAQQTEAREGR